MSIPIVRHTSDFFGYGADGYNEFGYNQSGTDRSGNKSVILKWFTADDVLAFSHTDNVRLLSHARRWLANSNIDSTKLQQIFINSRDDKEYRNGIIISYILILASEANASFLLNTDKPAFHWVNPPPIPLPPYNPSRDDLLNLDNRLKLLKNIQAPELDLETPWIWLKDLIWAVANGRGFTSDYWRRSRIMSLNVDKLVGINPTTIAITKGDLIEVLPKATNIVNAELDWFSKLVEARDYNEACKWMAVGKNVNVYVPEKQYRYGIPMRNVSRIAGMVAIPQNNASFVNYLVDAKKAGQIQNVQIKMDNDLSNIQPNIWYLSF